MKDISPGMREKIFALYWLQGVLKYTKCDDTYTNWLPHWRLEDKGIPYLELTPLSQITDEDAIEVARLNGVKTDNPLLVGKSLAYWLGNDKGRRDVIFEVADFLRSRGYALPAFGFSVEDLIEAGIFKLKENPAKAQ